MDEGRKSLVLKGLSLSIAALLGGLSFVQQLNSAIFNIKFYGYTITDFDYSFTFIIINTNSEIFKILNIPLIVPMLTLLHYVYIMAMDIINSKRKGKDDFDKD